ncbi:MAG: hypothetical protein LBI14_08755 [Treponema sp.]|jgi:hypothetical protein|nr:hypothetical protein [Treponema sp.]
MLRKIGFVILASLLLFSAACAGEPASHETVTTNTASSFFLSSHNVNGLVFIGVAGRRSNPKETLRLALEDAARRVAIFYNVTGEYAVQLNIGSGLFDYAQNTFTALYYDRGGPAQYIDALQFNTATDTLETENAFFIRTTYPATLAYPVSYSPVYDSDGKPDWVDNPPLEIGGYEVGVGYSGRYSSMADTCTNSYNNAIFAIIRNINTTAQSSDLYYQDTSLFGYMTSSNNVTYSYGTLTGLYALDMWIDPQTKAVSTLVIAPKF